MRRYYAVFACAILLAGSAMAQETRISGQVNDKNSGGTLPGVSILEKGTRNTAVTDTAGRYALIVSSDTATLMFSFIGYAVQEQAIAGRSTIDVVLSKGNTELGEVVVTALGVKREVRSLGYSVQRLEPKQIAEVKSPNFVDDLAGKLAGVTVTQGATGTGSTSKIVIRGEASFSNNNPLFVVDGTPVNNNSILNPTNEAAIGFQSVDFGNGAMELNADDIASVSVLKGPGAAALYGTRASNGVILVTTKDGSGSKGFGVSFNTTTFVDRPFQLPKFQNGYGQGNSGQFAFQDGLGGGTNDNISYSWGPPLDQGLLIAQFDSPVYLPNGQVVRGGDVAVRDGAPITPTPFISHPDNLKDFYRTGVTAINNLAITSGFNKGNFRLSYTDFRNTSIIPGSGLKRKDISAHLNFNPTDRLKIASTLTYVNSSSDNRPAGGYGSENVNYALVAWGPRSMDIHSLENYWQPGLENVQQFSFNYTYFDNPYLTLLENTNSFNRDRVFGNVALTYQITDHLSIQGRSGLDNSDELRALRRAFSTNRFQSGAYAEERVFYREVNSDVLVNYAHTYGTIGMDLSAGANRLDQQASDVQITAEQLAQPGIYSLNNAASPLEVYQTRANKRINSVYGIAKFNYKEVIYLDVTGRNDWSSALATPFSTANTGFFYPSVSGAFVLSQALKLPSCISFAKVRASLAQVGNDTGPLQTSSVYVAETPYSGQPTFSASDAIPNTNLKPERTTSKEFGADVRFFNDRLQFDLTYYDALTKDQIIALPVAISSGYTQQVVNGGRVRSQGIEAVISATPIQHAKFQWNMQFNFSRNVSRVEELAGGIDRLTLAYSRIYDNQNQTVWFQVAQGGRIGDMYGTDYKRNENGDYILTSDGNYITDNTLKKIGNYNPDFILGMNNSFTYGNWNLNFLVDWHQGGTLVSRTLALAGVGGQLEETAYRPDGGIVAKGVVNTGTDANPIWTPNTTAISAESYYRQYYDRNNEVNSSYNASYAKLRQFSIGYSFNTEKKKGLLQQGRSLNVAIIGRNLFAISHIPHVDPEQLAVQGQQFVSGVEDMSYATARSIGLKLGYDF